MKRYDAHPAADLFPMMTGETLKELAKDIRECGLQDPIVLWEGEILDGRNRYKACALAGVSPHFRTLDECASPVAYVLSANLHRRHLSRAECAAVAADALPMFEEEARKRQADGGKKAGRGRPRKVCTELVQTLPPQRAVAEAAKAVGAGRDATRTMVKIKREAPEVFAKVKNGEIKTVAEARRVAGVDGGNGVKLSTRVRELRDKGELSNPQVAEIAKLPVEEQDAFLPCCMHKSVKQTAESVQLYMAKHKQDTGTVRELYAVFESLSGDLKRCSKRIVEALNLLDDVTYIEWYGADEIAALARQMVRECRNLGSGIRSRRRRNDVLKSTLPLVEVMKTWSVLRRNIYDEFAKHRDGVTAPTVARALGIPEKTIYIQLGWLKGYVGVVGMAPKAENGKAPRLFGCLRATSS